MDIPLMATEPSSVALKLERDLVLKAVSRIDRYDDRIAFLVERCRIEGPKTDPRNDPTGVRTAETM